MNCEVRKECKKNNLFYQSTFLDYFKIPQVSVLGDLHV
jgi:hypothetical protein